MKDINVLSVFLDGRKIGTLAKYERSLTAFQYDESWLAEGFAVNPLSLPLEKKVFCAKYDPFEGLFGVFDDSLPDGWGRLLLDRLLVKHRVNPEEVQPLTRLAIVGNSGMGALEYRPEIEMGEKVSIENLDEIARECEKILETESATDLDSLFALGGSSGGARPKILTTYLGEDWIIKFPSSFDGKNIGLVEFEYAQCAKACGIEMSETKLFASQNCDGYFGTKRFDRKKDEQGNLKKIHMVSAGGLLETSHRIPNLDYNLLMKLTQIMTGNFEELEKLYRLMCFNVFAHNRDDHAKNFSYIYDEKEGKWHLSPAYDLTYSSSIGGEHATCINGNGKNPTMEDILAVAENACIASSKAQKIATDVQTITKELQRFFPR